MSDAPSPDRPTDEAEGARPPASSDPPDGAPPPLASTEGTSPPPAPNRWLNRGRLARGIALVGALVVVLSAKSLVLPLIPEERRIEVRVDSPSDLVGLDMRWAPAGGGEDIATTSLHFSPGTAPSSVTAVVHLPDGAYDVDIVAARSSRVDSTRRRIDLTDTSNVTIPLR